MFKKLSVFIGILTVFTLLLAGCGQASGSSTTSSVATTTASSYTAPPSRGITGTITTGKTVTATTATVGPTGGTVSITEAGTPLAGLALSIPAGAYQTTSAVTISYAPVEKQSFGPNFNPVTPLITVENGGGYADELMTVKVPVTVPAGSFAMGFYYDAATGTLEGMPLIDTDSQSVTVATRHFSSFVISVIPEALLTGNVDTGFKAGVDDWQLSNGGTIIVAGQCAGQSISSIWYYTEQPDGAAAHLYNRYDNDGDASYPTPDYEWDDSRALKLVTSVQMDYEEHNLAQEKKFRTASRVNDAVTYKLFQCAMLTTGAPQLLVTSLGVGGHALVAYKIAGSALYVADPNAPGDGNVNYKYNVATGKFESDNTLYYMATSALVSRSQVAARWAELENGTIGADRYPAYDILVQGEKGDWGPFRDGYVSKEKKITLKLTTAAANADFSGPIVTGSAGTTWIDKITKEVELNPGHNRLGVRVNGKLSTNQEGGGWAGFQYYDVVYGGLTIDPAAVTGKPGEALTFRAVTDNPPETTRYDWTLDGAPAQSGKANTYTISFSAVGNHTVGCALVGADGKEIASASAVVTIQAAADEDKLARLQKSTKLRGNLMVKGVKSWTDYDGAATETGSQPYNYRLSYDFANITWQGTSFSGSYAPATEGWSMSVEGVAAADGATITSLKVSLHPDTTRPDYVSTWTLEMSGVPLDYATKNIVQYQLHGAAVGGYFTLVNSSTRQTGSGGSLYEEKLLSPQWSAYEEGVGPSFFLVFQ